MTNFGGYKIFRPRLTKYCRGCVPGVVDAPDRDLFAECRLSANVSEWTMARTMTYLYSLRSAVPMC